jgi:plastocyanin
VRVIRKCPMGENTIVQNGIFVPRRALLAAAAGFVAFAMSGMAAAEEPVVTLRIKDHKFEPSELEIPVDTRVKIVVRNEDSTAEEFESHVLHREKMVRPGGQATIYVGPLSPGRYEFFGEKHPDTARGAVVVR